MITESSIHGVRKGIRYNKVMGDYDVTGDDPFPLR